MPNYTYCKLKAPEEVLKKYIRKDEDGDDIFDFDILIPMPEIYKDPELIAGGDENECIYWYLSNKGVNPLNRVLEDGKYIFDAYWYMASCHADPNVGGNDRMYERGKKYVDAMLSHGARDWYDWRRENWGTKWNAFDCKYDESNGYVEFNTAWTPPFKVIEKLFAENPKQMIAFFWTNEDYDGQHHLIRYKNGRVDKLNCYEYFQKVK